MAIWTRMELLEAILQPSGSIKQKITTSNCLRARKFWLIVFSHDLSSVLPFKFDDDDVAQHFRRNPFHDQGNLPWFDCRNLHLPDMFGYVVRCHWGTQPSCDQNWKLQDRRGSLHLPWTIHCRPSRCLVPLRNGYLGYRHGSLDPRIDLWYSLPWSQATRRFQRNFPTVRHWVSVHGRFVHLGRNIRHRSIGAISQQYWNPLDVFFAVGQTRAGSVQDSIAGCCCRRCTAGNQHNRSYNWTLVADTCLTCVKLDGCKVENVHRWYACLYYIHILVFQ